MYSDVTDIVFRRHGRQKKRLAGPKPEKVINKIQSYSTEVKFCKNLVKVWINFGRYLVAGNQRVEKWHFLPPKRGVRGQVINNFRRRFSGPDGFGSACQNGYRSPRLRHEKLRKGKACRMPRWQAWRYVRSSARGLNEDPKGRLCGNLRRSARRSVRRRQR